MVKQYRFSDRGMIELLEGVDYGALDGPDYILLTDFNREYAALGIDFHRCRNELSSLETRYLERLRELKGALRKHGHHIFPCDNNLNFRTSCVCGLDAILEDRRTPGHEDIVP